MGRFKLVFIYIIVVIVVVGLGYWLFTTSENKTQNLPGQTFENQGQQHIAEGSTDHPPYNSNPPTSGPHWPQPAEWGVYKTQQPDERFVHNLEHGGIWISYKPDKVDADTVARLEDFVKRFPLIVVEPRPGNDANISLAAWTHLENLDSFNERTILEFINAYHNHGPEVVM